jgi:hypothetical protein
VGHDTEIVDTVKGILRARKRHGATHLKGDPAICLAVSVPSCGNISDPDPVRRGGAVKIRKVVANNRKRVFVVHTARRTYEFPFAIAEPPPSADDRLVSLYVDEELGREGFTYMLESGREGSHLMDHVLYYNDDPTYLANLALYELTVRVLDIVEESPLGRREIIRRLGTSASQFYRLLDPTNYRKSMKQLVALLAILGYEVDVRLRRRADSLAPRPPVR